MYYCIQYIGPQYTVCTECVYESSVGMICQWCCALLTQDEELHYASGYDGSLEDIRLVYKRGADPNWKNPDRVSLEL